MGCSSCLTMLNKVLLQGVIHAFPARGSGEGGGRLAGTTERWPKRLKPPLTMRYETVKEPNQGAIRFH